MREFLDGFETGDFGLWDSSENILNVVEPASPVGMTGSQCAKIINGSIFKTVTARDRYYLAFKWRLTGNNATTLVTFYNGVTVLGTVKMNSNLLLQLYSGTSVLCATGTRSIAINTVYSIEVYYLPKTDGTGRFVLKINGITEIDFTGQTSGNAVQIDRFSLTAVQYCYLDDVILDSSAWIGPSKIQALVPTGAGTTTQWAPSTGANYTCVDEVPSSDTDYVATNTSANIDTYALSDLIGTIGSVKCVQVGVRGSYSGAPATTSLKAVIRSGGANYPSSSTVVLSTSPTTYALLWENDPATSTAWTTSGVNSMEAGIEAV